jgi:lysophospholipase L1-like esterase
MKKNRSLILLLFGLIIFFYGVAVGRYEIFPFQIIKMVRANFVPKYLCPKGNLKTFNTFCLPEFISPRANVVFIGDSLTKNGRWIDFLPNHKIVNRGVGGYTTLDLSKNINFILSTKPKKAFIMMGINDVMENVPISSILKNYELIIDSLIASNIEVIIQSTIQCEASSCGIKNVNSINTLNEGLSNLAISKEITFLNLKALSDVAGLDSTFSEDGIHLTTKAYLYWAEKIKTQLSSSKIS